MKRFPPVNKHYSAALRLAESKGNQGPDAVFFWPKEWTLVSERFCIVRLLICLAQGTGLMCNLGDNGGGDLLNFCCSLVRLNLTFITCCCNLVSRVNKLVW